METLAKVVIKRNFKRAVSRIKDVKEKIQLPKVDTSSATTGKTSPGKKTPRARFSSKYTEENTELAEKVRKGRKRRQMLKNKIPGLTKSVSSAFRRFWSLILSLFRCCRRR